MPGPRPRGGEHAPGDRAIAAGFGATEMTQRIREPEGLKAVAES
jgi:hypothetical protein